MNALIGGGIAMAVLGLAGLIACWPRRSYGGRR